MDKVFLRYTPLTASSVTIKDLMPHAFGWGGGDARVFHETRHGLNIFRLQPFENTVRNHWNMRKNTIDSLVLHFTASTFGSTINTFTNASPHNDRTSAHYVITEREVHTVTHETVVEPGLIFHVVPDDQAAWHVGKPAAAWGMQVGGWNHNTLGIECVGHGFFQDIEQKLALIHLINGLVQTYNIPSHRIYGHGDLDSSRSDPGVFCPWNLLAEQSLGAWLDDEDLDLPYIKRHHQDFPGAKASREERSQFFHYHLKKFGYHLNMQSLSLEGFFASGNGNREKVISFYAHFSCNQNPQALAERRVSEPTDYDLLWAWGLALKYGH